MATSTKTIALPDAYYENRLLTREQIQSMLGISKTALFRLLRNKKNPMPSCKIGGRRKFNLAKMIWWIEKQEG